MTSHSHKMRSGVIHCKDKNLEILFGSSIFHNLSTKLMKSHGRSRCEMIVSVIPIQNPTFSSSSKGVVGTVGSNIGFSVTPFFQILCSERDTKGETIPANEA